MSDGLKVDAYLHLIPQIEQKIRESNLDTLIWGMGPTGWLMRWMDSTLFRDLRLWTCHDGCRIYPAHDLVIMDPPVRALHPDTSRYQRIVDSRPNRIWIYPKAWIYQSPPRPGNLNPEAKPQWQAHLDKSVHGIVSVQNWRVWPPNAHPKFMKPDLGHHNKDGTPEPDTMLISPIGATTLAWSLGSRRIGILGVDLMQNHHHMHESRHQIDHFFTQLCVQAHALGGAIINLSPITSLERFKQWTPSASSSAPISGNETQAPSQSLSTAFAVARPATFPLPGCEAVTQDGKSAS